MNKYFHGNVIDAKSESQETHWIPVEVYRFLYSIVQVLVSHGKKLDQIIVRN